jgi:hypothetical protein
VAWLVAFGSTVEIPEQLMSPPCGAYFTPADSFTPDESTVLLYDGKHVDGDRVIDLSPNGHDGRVK